MGLRLGGGFARGLESGQRAAQAIIEQYENQQAGNAYKNADQTSETAYADASPDQTARAQAEAEAMRTADDATFGDGAGGTGLKTADYMPAQSRVATGTRYKLGDEVSDTKFTPAQVKAYKADAASRAYAGQGRFKDQVAMDAHAAQMRAAGLSETASGLAIKRARREDATAEGEQTLARFEQDAGATGLATRSAVAAAGGDAAYMDANNIPAEAREAYGAGIKKSTGLADSPIQMAKAKGARAAELGLVKEATAAQAEVARLRKEGTHAAIGTGMAMLAAGQDESQITAAMLAIYNNQGDSQVKNLKVTRVAIDPKSPMAAIFPNGTLSISGETADGRPFTQPDAVQAMYAADPRGMADLMLKSSTAKSTDDFHKVMGAAATKNAEAHAASARAAAARAGRDDKGSWSTLSLSEDGKTQLLQDRNTGETKTVPISPEHSKMLRDRMGKGLRTSATPADMKAVVEAGLVTRTKGEADDAFQSRVRAAAEGRPAPLSATDKALGGDKGAATLGEYWAKATGGEKPAATGLRPRAAGSEANTINALQDALDATQRDLALAGTEEARTRLLTQYTQQATVLQQYEARNR